MFQYALLALAGLMAGAMNAAAGGGSFVSFPALVATGVPSVSANMTSTVALFPGAFASAAAYRNDFKGFGPVSLPVMLVVSLVGGVAGALLLIYTPSHAFDVVVPWLLLVGTLAFAFGPAIGRWLRRRIILGAAPVIAAQLLLGVYGGYFGGAVGIMMMATWSVLGATDINAMNASKTLIVGATNMVAVIFFAISGGVYWPQAIVMLAAGVIGGYAGARIARRINPNKLRIGISCLNVAITAVFFWKTFM